ncbi:hypothetical protein Pan216_19710 [Planctomycetes bacterium Pan216]|uniref:Uncharacterized protein n=1 Tax=Kolteria novifilia TaxID=2527975 RepID=A0A518B2A7_9BACT|nr:hypothetical protein Pan216_19710 [Planctomycetes bacterium Pan216]
MRLTLPQGEGNMRLTLPQGEGNMRLTLPQGEGNKRLTPTGRAERSMWTLLTSPWGEVGERSEPGEGVSDSAEQG